MNSTLQKQKHQSDSGTSPVQTVSQQVSKVVRQFPQTKSIADNAAERKPRLSKDVLCGVTISLLIYNHIVYLDLFVEAFANNVFFDELELLLTMLFVGIWRFLMIRRLIV